MKATSALRNLYFLYGIDPSPIEYETVFFPKALNVLLDRTKRAKGEYKPETEFEQKLDAVNENYEKMEGFTTTHEAIIDMSFDETAHTLTESIVQYLCHNAVDLRKVKTRVNENKQMRVS